MEITINNKIIIQNAPKVLMAQLKSKLSFINPKWVENDRMGYWNGNTARMLKSYRVIDNGKITLPRGFIRQLISLCRQYNVNYEITDNRRVLPEVSFPFRAELRPYQEDAVTAMLRRDFGVLSSPPGSGKTVMALYLISQRKQPCLVICHTKELMRQWCDRANQFLDLPKDEIGIIGDGEMRLGKHLTVGIVNSVYKVAEEVSKHIGFLICDECHRCPSRTFTEAVSCFDSKYMLGLSATPWRRDGLSRLIYWFCGDVVLEIKKEDLIETGDILKAEVSFRFTDFDTYLDASEEYSKMLSELTQDHNRNKLIVKDVIAEARNGGGTCLILSDRKNRCEKFKALLRGHGIHAELLTGDVNGKDREAIVDRLNKGMVKVLIATGQLIGEGFDCPGLSTLFLTTPIKFDGRVIQYLGRVLRPAPGKDKAKVYDYIDSKIGVLRAAAKSRQRVYARNPAR